MYLSFYGLAEKPFSITPDPRYLFLSGRHAEALAHLVYGIDEAGGFIQLTGEVGTGKTTVIRSLLARAPQNAELALILNPRMEDAEFILTGVRGARHRRARRRARQRQGTQRHPQSLPAARACRRTARRAGSGRGAEPVAGAARAGAHADQPRDRIAEAAADHPDRPAGTARSALTSRAAPGRAAGDRAVSPAAADAARDGVVREASAARPPARPPTSSRPRRCGPCTT